MNNLYFAPVQGHTDAAYRGLHAEIYNVKDYDSQIAYFTPFIRLEHNSVRQRDLKDLSSSLNSNCYLTPQIIFRDKNELKSLIEILKKEGTKEIDLNMGCPFPLQTGHGRGAAAIANIELGKAIAEEIKNHPELSFSVKMRLGFVSPEEWIPLISTLNKINLKHIAIHPRVAKQQYGGEIDFEAFGKIVSESSNPIVFNGDIKTPAEINDIKNKFPQIKGVMVGRGILARPSLFSEYLEGVEWDKSKRIEEMLRFHRRLYDYYS
ncbi:MAG: tRNA-dihydrouridine synthase family protein, partial [Muribaculaceae bacterium]|nr:tRNA-dihydrouridine synthase family protein [Muribaculaceae bacterium]